MAEIREGIRSVKTVNMKKEKKVIRQGKVAVAVSHGFGAGWVTWNIGKISPFEPKVIAMIEAGKQNEINPEWCEEVLGIEGAYTGGASELEIEWVDEGERFSIDEYDGSESLYVASKLTYLA